jgi:hypothetical protein
MNVTLCVQVQVKLYQLSYGTNVAQNEFINIHIQYAGFFFLKLWHPRCVFSHSV